jgi:hypothetical protein
MSDTELLPEPKREPEPVRRLEVFTGAGRRRRWTAEQKTRIVAESYESGETVCAGCAPARVDAAAVVRMAPAYAAGGRRGRQGDRLRRALAVQSG